MSNGAHIDIEKQQSIIEQNNDASEMPGTTPSSEKESEEERGVKKSDVTKKEKIKKTVKIAVVSVVVVGVVAASILSIVSISNQKKSLEGMVATNSNGLQLLHQEMLSLRENINNLEIQIKSSESIRQDNGELKVIVEGISKNNAALSGDVQRLAAKLNTLSRNLDNYSGIESQLAKVKADIIGMQTTDKPAISKAKAPTPVTLVDNPAILQEKTVAADDFNLRLISVDRWAGTAQAVFKTPDGVTFFMNQGEIRNGWRLVDIDFHKKSVQLSNGKIMKSMNILL